MKKMMNWEIVKKLIDEHQIFILTTHVSPDGDGIGCEIALSRFLKKLGKEVFIYNSTPTPSQYRFLDRDGEIAVYNPNRDWGNILRAQVYFILDIGDFRRLKDVGNAVRMNSAPTVCIDHHPSENDDFDYFFLDERACATAELVYSLIKYCGGEIDTVMAESLYTAILTDTGSFRFSNTNPEAHRIAMELISRGIKPDEIYARVYENITPVKMKLLSEALRDLHYEYGGKLAWFRITKEMLRKSKADTSEIEGFTDFVRTIQGVRVSLMLLQLSDKRTKVSFRSKGEIEVNRVARKWGGGGHKYAAGCLIQKPMEDVINKIIGDFKDQFDRAG